MGNATSSGTPTPTTTSPFTATSIKPADLPGTLEGALYKNYDLFRFTFHKDAELVDINGTKGEFPPTEAPIYSAPNNPVHAADVFATCKKASEAGWSLFKFTTNLGGWVITAAHG